MLGVAHVLGLMLAMFGALYVIPLAVSLVTGDGVALDYVIAGAVNAIVGLSIGVVTRRHARELKPRDGFLLVTLAWGLMAASATIPLMMVIPGLSFTDAYFEATSGLTTTGSTVLVGLDDLPPSLNIWRHTLHWVGGLGVIVLAVALLPVLGVGGMQLYKAEAPGPVKDEKLAPRITETAKSLWLTYAGLTIAGIIALRMCGMTWLDAINHSFSAMALGGFSSHDASIGYFDSRSIEAVLIALMCIATLNFGRHFVALRKLTLAPYRTDPEAKAIFAVLIISVPLVAGILTLQNVYPSFGESLRHSAFNVISLATTTGFVSQDYQAWPVFVPILMLFLSCVVCSTGSTGGGIKMFRTLLLSRQAGRELKLLVHPNAVAPVRVGGKAIPDRVADSVLGFIFLYFMVVVALTFALLATGLDFETSLTAIVASINNAGPGLGSVGPAGNYRGLTDVQTWLCSIAMLLGRLEIFSVLVLFTPAFWRK